MINFIKSNEISPCFASRNRKQSFRKFNKNNSKNRVIFTSFTGLFTFLHNKNKIFLVFFIILYALFLPIPKYINKTLDGYEITRKKREKDTNGDVIGEVELNVVGNAEIKIKG